MFFENLSYQQLLWFIPLLFALHNLEEAPFMERWLKRISLPFRPQMSTSEFTFAVVFLTLGIGLLTAISALNPPTGLSVFIMILIQAIMLVNAIIPHLVASLWYRLYSPGVLTGVLLQIPFSIYLFQRVMEDHLLNAGLMVLAFVLAPILMPVAAWLALKISKRLIGLWPSRHSL